MQMAISLHSAGTVEEAKVLRLVQTQRKKHCRSLTGRKGQGMS